MIDNEKLLAKYADNLANSENRNHYLRNAQHFLDNAKGLDRASIDDYVAQLQEVHKPSTVNFKFRVIHRLYVVNDLPWEYRRGEAPLIRQGDEYRPQLSRDIVRMMILAAKNGKLYTEEQCFIALSTVYGLRRQELQSLQPKDIDLETNVLCVATSKSGRERHHIIPAEIRPYLKAHDFNKRYATATISQIFRRILVKSGAKKLTASRIGWNSIRRALLDGLLRAGVDGQTAQAFLRWKAGTRDLAIPTRYQGSVVVGLGRIDSVPKVTKEDKEVFAKHPFLRFWRA
jgi:integrase